MAAAETRHADHMEKMKGIIIGNPERFSTGPPFNPAGLKTVMAGIRDHHEKSNARLIPRERFLILTRDIERSVLAAHYAGIVRTDDSCLLYTS
ncbi:MAG: hypothetical protein N2Z74_06300, partial [Syntrophales bacterium]|nr:hypothetical protein [Syntrophales bacterium]